MHDEATHCESSAGAAPEFHLEGAALTSHFTSLVLKFHTLLLQLELRFFHPQHNRCTRVTLADWTISVSRTRLIAAAHLARGLQLCNVLSML